MGQQEDLVPPLYEPPLQHGHDALDAAVALRWHRDFRVNGQEYA
jgi:hypothetical protein